MAISTAKLREEVLALTDMKVDIMLNDEEFKSTYQIMEEISRVWKDIADVDQAALLELLGGKRQANILSSMLTNFETAQKALEKSSNSAGSAMAENEKYLDSISGKLKQLEAAWESLSATVLSSELVKGLLDFAISFVQAIDKIISALGSLETAVSGAVMGIAAKKGIGGLFAAIAKGSGVAEAAMLGLKGGLVGLGVAVISVMGIKFVKWLWNIADTSIDAQKNINDLSAEISSLENKDSDFTQLAQRFKELSDQTSLSAEEAQEYIDVQNQLHDLLPSLKGYYDEHGNYIIEEIHNVEDAIAIWKEYIRTKKEDLADEYLRDPFIGDSAYQNDLDDLNNLRLRQSKIKEYLRLMSKMQNGEALTQTETIFVDSWDDVLGDIDQANRILRETGKEIDEVNNKLKSNALTAVQATEGWNNLSKEEQEAIRQVINSFDSARVDHLFDVFKDPEQDVIEWLLSEFPKEVQAALDAAQQAAQQTVEGIEVSSGITAGDIDIAPYVELDEAVESLGDAYVQFAEKSQVSLESLNNLKTTFGACGDEWDAFINTVSSGDSTLEDVKRATNDLASKYVQNKVALGQVNEATKDHITSMLKQIGVENAESVVKQALIANQREVVQQVLAEQTAKKDATTTTEQFKQAVLDECISLGIEAELANQLYTEITGSAEAKAAAALDTSFRDATQKDIDKLLEEAVAADLAATEIAKLNTVKAAKQTIAEFEAKEAEGGTFSASETLAYQKAQRDLEAADADLEAFKAKWGEGLDLKLNVDHTDALDALRRKSASTTDAVSKEFEQMYDELQYLRDANLISEQEYLQKLYQLNEQYNKKNLATYRKYQLQIFQGIKSMLAGQINSQADSQISALESQRDATERRYDALIKAKEKEKEQKEKYYDDLIEAEQDRLDQLKEEWTVQDHLLKIEQARAALAAAQQQKTVHIYKEGEGFVWERDEEAVGAAQDDLNEAVKSYDRYNQEQEIKDRIDAIEEEKETVLEALEEEIEALEEAKDRALESIDQQIAAVEAWREEALDALEEVGLTLEDFLEFFEMFGIEVDEGLMKLIEDFAKMAQESGTNIDELTGKVQDLESALSGLTNGEYAADLEATDGKANPETGADDPVNVFEEFTEAVKLWKDETVSAIDEVNLRFEELLEHLDEFETKTEFLKTWQTEAMTALTDLGLKLTDFLALLDQFNVRFDEDVPLWEDAILTALDEVSLKINDFIVLLDNFDTTIDEGLLSLVDSFANMAAESSYHIDLIITKLQELSDALAALGNGEYVTGATTGDGEGATDAGSDANDAFSTTDGNLFEAIIDQFRVLNEETAKHLDLIKDKWYTTIEDIQLLLNNFKEDGLDMIQEAVAESILEMENQLTLFGEFLNQFSLDATEALQPLVDQFNKLFIGEIEHTYEDGSTEMLSWIDYYKVMIDEIIAKHDEWWEYIIEYLEFVEEAHDWLNTVLEEQIEKVEEWKTSLIEDMDELIQKMKELASVAEDTSNRVGESFNTMSGAVQSAASEISGACESIANAINSLPDGKTITITTVYRTVYETVGSPSGDAPSNVVAKKTVVPTSPSSDTPKTKDTRTEKNTSKYSSPSVYGPQQSHDYTLHEKKTVNPSNQTKLNQLQSVTGNSGKKSSSDWYGFAEGTLTVPTTGMALTDEEGPEIRIPGKGTFRKLHYGDAILPADVSRNLWMIGAKPVSFAKGIANMITNKNDDKRQNVFNFGDIHLPNVQNAQNFADEFKDIVMKATQLAYSK